ncbi:hypothetical protein E2C01_050515 [Portunus trituberculatus]|uniref:Uncharacterized protein n=1 Tax=Portunus trituberculatus TaxID=210409 RepID=A0A5B7GGQ4_PORTR|nr:hypothetical protein [Portunus trituberculatus]
MKVGLPPVTVHPRGGDLHSTLFRLAEDVLKRNNDCNFLMRVIVQSLTQPAAPTTTTTTTTTTTLQCSSQ